MKQQTFDYWTEDIIDFVIWLKSTSQVLYELLYVRWSQRIWASRWR